MSRSGAVTALFVAFGVQRNVEQAKLYVDELTRAASCGECAEIATQNLMRTSRRLPALSQVLEEVSAVVSSEAHYPHVVRPQLAPRAETWWRSEAVKVILPHAGGDRSLALLVAAQMWWTGIPGTLDAVAAELADYPIWVESATSYAAGRDIAALVEAAFRRARFAHEQHPGAPIPEALLMLQEASA